jgi:hypothetical protein
MQFTKVVEKVSVQQKNVLVQFPIKRARSLDEALNNAKHVSKSMTTYPHKTHFYVNLTNYVVLKYPIYPVCNDIIHTALNAGHRISVEIPNPDTTGKPCDVRLEHMALRRFNKKKVNVFKVYHINDKNAETVFFDLSANIRMASRHIGVHLKQDALNTDPESKEYFFQCCRLALTNSYDNHKDVELLIEINSDESINRIQESLAYYGQDVYYKIKIAASPCYELKDTQGFSELKVVPYGNDWLSYMRDIVLEKNSH